MMILVVEKIAMTHRLENDTSAQPNEGAAHPSAWDVQRNCNEVVTSNRYEMVVKNNEKMQVFVSLYFFS